MSHGKVLLHYVMHDILIKSCGSIDEKFPILFHKSAACNFKWPLLTFVVQPASSKLTIYPERRDRIGMIRKYL